MDFEKAKARAATENKDLFLVFTGSDWSKSCQRFEREILSEESFQTTLSSQFLLVRIDLPLRSNLPKEVKEAKRDLADRMVVDTWPTSVYLDAKGRPFYRERGILSLKADKYAAHILVKQRERTERDARLKAADQLEGMARASAIVKILETLPRESVLEFYPDQVADLERLDTEDSLGFLKQRRSEKALNEIERSLPKLFNHQSFDRLIKNVDDYLKVYQPEGELRQKALTFKMAAYENSARPDEALKLAKEIVKSGPGTSLGKSAALVKKRLEARK